MKPLDKLGKFPFLLFVLLGATQACTFNKNVQGRGDQALQGIWVQQTIPYKEQLMEYTETSYTFTCDSFYASFVTHGKHNRYEDQCFNEGIWKEYARGTYAASHDTVYLNGTFTKPNWKQKITGCYRIGQYLDALHIIKNDGDTLSFQSAQSHVPVSLILKKRITCDPKPIE
ncbi:fumarate hydratase [Pedobacter sp. HMF7647]|uniref:Fumarate hydratase n=1 Tax=Hufsiella arboris TaxID=2695275 RepID=A0A7K1Y552_9SPHI|nr:fumarate hydratase [Hufsiella arboris]MXV49714.1 fumarate hydratase [Hufsiella arboris]